MRQGFGQISAQQGRGNGPAQIRLRQRGRGRIHRRQRRRQLTTRNAKGRVHHLPPPEAAFDLASNTQARAHSHGFLLRWVKAEKCQQASACAVIHSDVEHAPGAQLHFAMRDRGFDLYRIAIPCVLQLGDAGFVLVAQRQVQGQIDITGQP